MLIGTLGTNFSEILIEIHIFSFKKMHLKTSSAKWWPFCLGLNVRAWVGNYISQFFGVGHCNHISKFTARCNYSSMMTSSNGNIFRVTGSLCGEFTGPGEVPTQRPVTRSFDVFFDLCLNKRLSKQPWGWWFETPSWSLWRHCNDLCSNVWIS